MLYNNDKNKDQSLTNDGYIVTMPDVIGKEKCPKDIDEDKC